jgi:hypothetical protein
MSLSRLQAARPSSSGIGYRVRGRSLEGLAAYAEIGVVGYAEDFYCLEFCTCLYCRLSYFRDRWFRIETLKFIGRWLTFLQKWWRFASCDENGRLRALPAREYSVNGEE